MLPSQFKSLIFCVSVFSNVIYISKSCPCVYIRLVYTLFPLYYSYEIYNIKKDNSFT